MQPLPSRQAERQVRSVQSGTRGSAECEAGQTREEEFAGDQALEPEIKLEHQPFTIRGYFGIGE